MLIILIRTVKLMFRIYENRGTTDLRRNLALYSGAILIALMCNAMFSDTFQQDYFWMLGFFLAGTAAASRPDEVKLPQPREVEGTVRGATS